MNHDHTLTAVRLRELLDYDSETGDFRWKVSTNGVIKVGQLAGTADGAGYMSIMVGKILRRSHRLAWLYVYGEWPVGFVDHINCVKTDNRIVNLREVTRAQNSQNVRGPRSDNTSGYLGVSYHRRKQKWVATLTAHGVHYRLGAFTTAAEAGDAYLAAKARLHPFSTLGERYARGDL